MYAYPDMPNEAGFDEATTTTANWGFYKTVTVISGVVRVTAENMAPVQNDAVRYVPEGTPRHKYVDDPVTASDPGDQLVYELGGAGGSSFYIAETTIPDDGGTADRNEAADAGQIRVGARTSLDHEGQDAYMVEVTATDTYNSSDSGDVTINVVDVDEAPVIRAGGLSVRGSGTISYAENRMDAVATYMADGADAAGAKWSLSGDDMGDFKIGASTGVLTFKATPNYEAPTDADGNNVYQVTVNASSGEYSATLAVTVRVTDEDEGTNAAPEFARCDCQQKRAGEYRGRTGHRRSGDGY